MTFHSSTKPFLLDLGADAIPRFLQHSASSGPKPNFDKVSHFFVYCESQEFCIKRRPLPLDQQKSDVLTMDWDATIIIHSPTTNNFYIAVNSIWWAQYSWPHLGSVHECFIAKHDQDYLKGTALRTLPHSFSWTFTFKSKTADWTQGCVVKVEVPLQYI